MKTVLTFFYCTILNVFKLGKHNAIWNKKQKFVDFLGLLIANEFYQTGSKGNDLYWHLEVNFKYCGTINRLLGIFVFFN